MRLDDLDRMLSNDEDIVPSSGFTSSVMDLVRREASVPPPIPFPWLRLVLGSLALLGVVAVLTWAGVTEELFTSLVGLSGATWARTAAWAAGAAARKDTAWIAGALLLAVGSTLLSLRVARPRVQHLI